MENCIFCKIVNNEIPSYKVYEDKNYLAFLDAFPSSKGQTLIIPKKHIAPYLFNMDDKEYNEIFLIAKKIIKSIDNSLKPIKTALVVEGFQVEHIHIRIHPCYEHYLNLHPMQNKPSEQEFKEIAEKIKKAL